jgi:hypothetical protein
MMYSRLTPPSPAAILACCSAALAPLRRTAGPPPGDYHLVPLAPPDAAVEEEAAIGDGSGGRAAPDRRSSVDPPPRPPAASIHAPCRTHSRPPRPSLPSHTHARAQTHTQAHRQARTDTRLQLPSEGALHGLHRGFFPHIWPLPCLRFASLPCRHCSPSKSQTPSESRNRFVTPSLPLSMPGFAP